LKAGRERREVAGRRRVVARSRDRSAADTSHGEPELRTAHLLLRPLAPTAAAALPGDRSLAARLIGATLSDDWPLPDLLDVLPLQASASAEDARFGVWIVIEVATQVVVGDIGFIGPPGDDGIVEIGYSVVPDRRGHRYAAEAGLALVGWAFRVEGVNAVVAGTDADNLPSIWTLEHLGFSRTGDDDLQLRWRIDSMRSE
jgi:ribosomal-protein-alanine N-acetyltransferase